VKIIERLQTSRSSRKASIISHSNAPSFAAKRPPDERSLSAPTNYDGRRARRSGGLVASAHEVPHSCPKEVVRDATWTTNTACAFGTAVRVP